MRIYTDKHLQNFVPWSGAKDTMAELTFKQVDALNDIIEELYPDGIDETELNDILWFERDTVAEWLGYENWEALQRENNGDEDDEDEEDDDEEDGLTSR